jgi:uncharacterized membrane protein
MMATVRAVAQDADEPKSEKSTHTPAYGDGRSVEPVQREVDAVTFWERGEEPEFGRIAFFTDAVFAIALTLLVLDLRLPRMSGNPNDSASILNALGDLTPKFVSFGVAFALLAKYWMANHRFFARIGRFDKRYLTICMCYLATVAFLPFPTSLIGEYESNPISGVLFALSLAAVSGLETVLLWHAQRAGLMQTPASTQVYRWQVVGSMIPFTMFLVTIPLAFVSPTLMLLSWIVIAPMAGRWAHRRKPADAT